MQVDFHHEIGDSVNKDLFQILKDRLVLSLTILFQVHCMNLKVFLVRTDVGV